MRILKIVFGIAVLLGILGAGGMYGVHWWNKSTQAAANEPPKLLSDKFQSAAAISLMPDGRTLLVPDMKGGTLTWFPIP